MPTCKYNAKKIGNLLFTYVKNVTVVLIYFYKMLTLCTGTEGWAGATR